MDSKARFSDRVEDYVRFRPSYPPALLRALVERTGLAPNWTVADLGSGTGLSSRLVLENGNVVVGVEPNAEMRGAAERLLAGFPLPKRRRQRGGHGSRDRRCRSRDRGSGVSLVRSGRDAARVPSDRPRAGVGGAVLEHPTNRRERLRSGLRAAARPIRHRLRADP